MKTETGKKVGFMSELNPGESVRVINRLWREFRSVSQIPPRPATSHFWLKNLHTTSKTLKTNLRHSQVCLTFETVFGRVEVVYSSQMSNFRYTSFMFGEICKE